MLRALRHKNYALFFTGQSVSLIGTWMQQMAVAWLVYRKTGSAVALGVVGFASQIPAFFLTPFTGVIADRSDRHKLFIATQVMAMLQAFLLAALVISGVFKLWELIALSAMLGIVNAVDIPVRHSFIVEIVDKKEDLGNAIALNSMIFNGARFVGPSLAGLIVARLGEGVCFFINGISYLAVIAALFAMKIEKERPSVRRHKPLLEGLRDGFLYAFGVLPIKRTLALLSTVSLFGSSYLILMPIFTRDVLKGGATTLGFLIGASGVGALAGAMRLAWRRKTEGLEKIIISSTAIFGFGLIALASSRVLLLSLCFMALIGFGLITQAVGTNTLLQMTVDDDKRGRVMSLFAMAFMGIMPFGNLLAGAVAARIGAPLTLAVNGCICLIGVLIFGRR
jgi:MFS family permease